MNQTAHKSMTSSGEAQEKTAAQQTGRKSSKDSTNPTDWARNLNPKELRKKHPHLTEDEILSRLETALKFGAGEAIFRVLLMTPDEQKAWAERERVDWEAKNQGILQRQAEIQLRTKEVEAAYEALVKAGKKPSIRIEKIDGFSFALVETVGDKSRRIMQDVFPGALAAAEHWLRHDLGILT